MEREIDNPENYKFNIFYYNPKDKRIIVPKQDRYRGWTVNFGNFYTYLIIVTVFLVILFYNILL